jgi:hypothetical protein
VYSVGARRAVTRIRTRTRMRRTRQADTRRRCPVAPMLVFASVAAHPRSRRFPTPPRRPCRRDHRNFRHTSISSATLCTTCKPSFTIYLPISIDTVCPRTDGLAMAASFYSSPLIGATTTLACFAHEIPHEIADYSILVRAGFTKRQAMQSQFLTAVGAFVRFQSFSRAVRALIRHRRAGGDLPRHRGSQFVCRGRCRDAGDGPSGSDSPDGCRRPRHHRPTC